MCNAIAKCLIEHMNLLGAHAQFGHIGCLEALLTLRNIIITRWQHGKKSFVLFDGLVKAFATADHKVVGRNGVPDSLIEVIHKFLQAST